MFGFLVPVEDINSYAHYRPVPAIYGRAPVSEGGLLPCFGGSGTGGVEGLHFVRFRQGYRPYLILGFEEGEVLESYAPFTDLMKEVKVGFGRTMSHLPAVFGVSRQTLYNWMNGEVPKAHHRGKLQNLVAAARVFTHAGFKPTALALDRTIVNGKSFLELLSEGADGRDAALRLVRIEMRGAAARAKLDAMLGERSPTRLEVSDLGRLSFGEIV